MESTLVAKSVSVLRIERETIADARDHSALWGAAIAGMIAVPGAERIAAPNGVLYLAPLPPGAAPPEGVEWPKVLAKSAVFALTAHN